MVNPDDVKAVITRMEDEDGSRARRRDLAEALNVLLRSTNAETIVEVSSSKGYLSLWLALGAESTDGHLYIYESDTTPEVKKNISQAGLSHRVTVIGGEPTAENLPDDIDFLVLDADKNNQLRHYGLIFPHVKDGGTIVSDNSISHFAELREYINEVRIGGKTSSVMFPLGEGLEVTYKAHPDDQLNPLYTDLIR